MQNKTRLWSAAFFSSALALAGCMKSGEQATGLRPEVAGELDATHGGARIALPEIDPAALGKTGKDTPVADTLAKAWFELSITGENMKEMFYRFPLPNPGNLPFEIKGIPAGKKRSFHGSLLNGNRVATHEGITQADIQAGTYAEIRLFLAKAGGSAAVCVVIEGHMLPPCAGDTLKPPPNPWPEPDSGAIGGCWQFSSAWLSGKVKLYDSVVNGMKGVFQRDSGGDLPFTTWARHGDTLVAILISPNFEEKWLLQGWVSGKNEAWTGGISNHATGKTTSFAAKSLPCSVVADPGKVPTDPVPNPKPVPGAAGSIPLPRSGAPRTTLCFEMRFDYANSACEVQGLAKMDFLDGKIVYGYIMVADRPNREYTVAGGSYDSAAIAFYGITRDDSAVPRDTLSLRGYMGAGATMAKGDYQRWPSGTKGIWTLNAVACGSWTPKYPDASCSAAKSP